MRELLMGELQKISETDLRKFLAHVYAIDAILDARIYTVPAYSRRYRVYTACTRPVDDPLSSMTEYPVNAHEIALQYMYVDETGMFINCGYSEELNIIAIDERCLSRRDK